MIDSKPRSLRNDLLPEMHLQTLAIADLKMPKHMVRKLDPRPLQGSRQRYPSRSYLPRRPEQLRSPIPNRPWASRSVLAEVREDLLGRPLPDGALKIVA